MVTLYDAKAHLSILDNSQDALITSLIAAAEAACGAYLALAEDAERPATLDTAVKMTVANMFEGREGAFIPAEALSLLNEHREWVFG
ncbi:MAG: head-tail connector protein [Brevundimonas sp.]